MIFFLFFNVLFLGVGGGGIRFRFMFKWEFFKGILRRKRREEIIVLPAKKQSCQPLLVKICVNKSFGGSH